MSTRALKIAFVRWTQSKQITKACNWWRGKMRRAQEADKASAPKIIMAAEELLSYLASQGATDNHPLFVRAKDK